MASAAQTAYAPGQGNQSTPPSQAQRARPFCQAAKEGTEQGAQYTITPGTNTQTKGPDPLPATGYIRRILLQTVATGGGATTAGVFTAGGDAPFNLYNLIRLSEPNAAPIFELSGYNTLLANCYGGYAGVNDPRNDPDYSANASNPVIMPFIPVEIDPTGLGSLSNLSNASAFRLTVIYEATSNVYSTAPVPLPSVQTTVQCDYWTLPKPADADGNPQATAPPFPGTIQLWSQIENNALAAGNNRSTLTRMGNQLRTVIMRTRQSGLGSDTPFPNPYTLRWDDINLRVDSTQALRKRMKELNNGLTARDAGVYVFPYNQGVTRFAGGNGISSWLPTVTATRYELSGSSSGAGTLDWIINDVSQAPVSGVQRATVGGGLGYYPPSPQPTGAM